MRIALCFGVEKEILFNIGNSFRELIVFLWFNINPYLQLTKWSCAWENLNKMNYRVFVREINIATLKASSKFQYAYCAIACWFFHFTRLLIKDMWQITFVRNTIHFSLILMLNSMIIFEFRHWMKKYHS